MSMDMRLSDEVLDILGCGKPYPANAANNAFAHHGQAPRCLCTPIAAEQAPPAAQS